MKMLFRAAVLGALLTTSALTAQAQVQAPPAPAADSMFRATTLNLSSYGEVRTAPDMANITIGVMTEARTAAEAIRLNAAKMTEVMASLRRAGINERDIQTSSISLNPQYVYQENQPPRLNGYQASNQVNIRVLDLARLGQAIDATVAAGANQIHGISFGLQNPRAAEDDARRKAVEALKAKADLYAQATGHRISRLVTLSEGGGYSAPPPMPLLNMARAAQFDAKESTPVSGGELVVRIDISGLYELAPVR